MKVWKTLTGLVFDDWWLFLGTLVGLILVYLGLAAGLNPTVSGWIWLLFICLALTLSLRMEYRRKIKS